MAKSRISRGGIAPPQGLMRPALSSSSHLAAAPRQIVGRRRAGGPAADHNHVEDLVGGRRIRHERNPSQIPAASGRSEPATRDGAGRAAIRAAIAAEMTNSSASPRKAAS